ncbi:MAG: ATP-binding protein [Proteobacteria bacterium]|nr:ATP-binding protein [Pseudomonadota bacterium]
MQKYSTTQEKDLFLKEEVIPKRDLFKAMFFFGGPLLAGMAVNSFLSERYPQSASVFLLLVAMAALFFGIKKVTDIKMEHRLYTIFFVMFYLFLGYTLVLVLGIEKNLSRVPWFYLFPFLIMAAVGHKKGLIWMAVMFLALVATLEFYPGSGEVVFEDLQTRFLISVVITTLICFYVEYQNRTYQRRLVSQRMNLEQKNQELKLEIAEREKAEQLLKQAQKEMVEQAHKAGMAEIAADTLHNIGNVLNSVVTSAQVIKDSVNQSPSGNFSKVCQLIEEHADDLPSFFSAKDKGIKAIEYILKLDEAFAESYDEIGSNVDRLASKVDTITQVVVAQQNYAGNKFLIESLDISTILEDALSLVPSLFMEQSIHLEKNLEPVPEIKVPKIKLLHILVNILKNAAQALVDQSFGKKRIMIRLKHTDQRVVLEVTDTGQGIDPENLEKIFNHGFTTKEDGFGFGLHSCANYMAEMNGKISAYSDGPGKGATFRLEFPILQ